MECTIHTYNVTNLEGRTELLLLQKGGSTSGRQAVEAGWGRAGMRRTGRPSANVGIFKLLHGFKFWVSVEMMACKDERGYLCTNNHTFKYVLSHSNSHNQMCAFSSSSIYPSYPISISSRYLPLHLHSLQTSIWANFSIQSHCLVAVGSAGNLLILKNQSIALWTFDYLV